MSTAQPDERFTGREKREILIAIQKAKKLPSIFHAEDVLANTTDEAARGFLPKEFK